MAESITYLDQYVKSEVIQTSSGSKSIWSSFRFPLTSLTSKPSSSNHEPIFRRPIGRKCLWFLLFVGIGKEGSTNSMVLLLDRGDAGLLRFLPKSIHRNCVSETVLVVMIRLSIMPRVLGNRNELSLRPYSVHVSSE